MTFNKVIRLFRTILIRSSDIGNSWTCSRLINGNARRIQSSTSRLLRKKRTFKFLHGLYKELDEVRGRFMGVKPFPSLREAKSRRKIMLGPQEESVEQAAVEGSALAARGASNNHDY